MKENLKTTKMRMLRMLCGKTLKDNISNDKVCKMTRVESIDEFLRGQGLQWLGHVGRTGKEKGRVKALHFKLKDTKKGRLIKRWKKLLEQDMTTRKLQRMNDKIALVGNSAAGEGRGSSLWSKTMMMIGVEMLLLRENFVTALNFSL